MTKLTKTEKSLLHWTSINTAGTVTIVTSFRSGREHGTRQFNAAKKLVEKGLFRHLKSERHVLVHHNGRSASWVDHRFERIEAN
jgi:hypothetical protein